MRRRPRFRDDFGAPTAIGRRVGIFAGALLLLAVGVAVGRLPTPPSGQSAVVPTSPRASAPTTAGTTGAQSRGGAIAAAAEIDCTLGGSLVVSPTNYAAAVAVLLAPDQRYHAADIAASESNQLESQTGAVSAAAAGRAVYISCVPLGYRVESYAATAAAVSVWTEQIVGIDGSYTPSAAYVTETLELIWAGGAWKLEKSSVLDSAWAPAVRQLALPQGTALPSQMLNFIPYGAS